MRALLLIVLASAAALAQDGPAPVTTLTAANPHMTLRALVQPETVSPKSKLTITFEVTPGRRIHVYAPGAEYQVIAVALDPVAGVTAHDLDYPPSELYHFEPLDEVVPVYQKPFTLTQVVTVAPEAVKGKTRLVLAGKLAYQACDDRVCFRPNAIPFKFELPVAR